MEFTNEERDLIVQGLYMKKNYIETGNPVLCAGDLKRMDRDKEVRALSVDQMRVVVALDDLIHKMFGIQRTFGS